jgi:hypothetical protein
MYGAKRRRRSCSTLTPTSRREANRGPSTAASDKYEDGGAMLQVNGGLVMEEGDGAFVDKWERASPMYGAKRRRRSCSTLTPTSRREATRRLARRRSGYRGPSTAASDKYEDGGAMLQVNGGLVMEEGCGGRPWSLWVPARA